MRRATSPRRAGSPTARRATQTDSGDLDAADVDNTADGWQAVAAGAATANGYGTYQLSAAGVWTYTLDDNNAAVQALNGAATLTDTFTALTEDGTAQVVTVTIHAQNDAAVITGTSTGDVTEAGGVANGTPGTPTASGDLDATDVDNTADAWQAVAAGAASANGYGTYELTRRRRLDLHARRQQCGGAGAERRRDADRHVHASTGDGTTQIVTITIHGARTTPRSITGTATGDVTEAGGVANGTPGTPTATGDLDADRCRQHRRRLAGGRGRRRERRTATAPTRSRPRACGPTRSTTAMRRCRR